jgi:hypothetical protein
VNEAGLGIAEIKRAYLIPGAWRDLQLDGAPGKCVCSPFRSDDRPSFSVFADGKRWRDFGTNERGDVVDFVRRALGADTKGALAWIRERLGFISDKNSAGKKPRIPTLRFGSDAELQRLSEQRGFNIEALKLAEAHGFLRFCEFAGQTAWCVTDRRRKLYEFRRLDGAPWPAYKHLAVRKSHCIGVGKNWPIGALEVKGFKKCVGGGCAGFCGAIQFPFG